MEAEAETDAEVVRLQAMLRDVVALSAIPAVWIGTEPPAVVSGLADTLVGLLELDFVFVRLSDPGGAGDAGTVEVTRGAGWASFPEWLAARLTPTLRAKEVVPDVGDDAVRRRGFAVPIGVSGQGGVVAAASGRSDFPSATDQLLLSLAANQAAAAFRSARLVDERRQAEARLRDVRDELEAMVAERTGELHLANAELDALRRVATLVAEGIEPKELFAVVAEEVGRLFGSNTATVVTFDHDDPAIVLEGIGGELASVVPVGTRWDLDDALASAEVCRTGHSARIDDADWSSHGPIAAGQADVRIVSTVASPIIVQGLRWGAVTVVSVLDPLPPDTEARLENFTELVATAIANAESGRALGRLADEQTTLRRMATMVAQGGQPGEIFSAVSEEVGRLLGTDTAAVVRFEHNPPGMVVESVGKSIPGIPVGSRSELVDGLASTEVYRTGRSARIDARVWASISEPLRGSGRREHLGSTVASPIVVGGRLWGTLSVSAEEPFPLDAEERLEKFTELVATALANADTRAELAASRRRIVAASDEARRRIERDLHDGTQQRLVSLGLAVRAAEAAVPPDRTGVRAELSRIAIELGDAVEELQEISRGIHPPILAEGGLGPALRALARRSPIPVELDVNLDARLPEPIEVAVYYVTSEAFANAAKHAQASWIEVLLAPRDGRLFLSIRDDGVGGADRARGSGLVGVTDRVEALGGSAQVESRPLEGTQITVELPLEPEVGGRH